MELERQTHRVASGWRSINGRQPDLADVAWSQPKREKRRADEANKVAVISVIDYEKAQDDLRNAELAHAHAVADADLFDERLAFELKAKELEVQRQQIFVEDLQRQVDDLSIRSPVNGVVGDLLVEQKSAVSRDTPVMAVVDLSRFEIDAQVPESYADDLGLGMAAEILFGNERYTGTLVAVSPKLSVVRSAVAFASATDAEKSTAKPATHNTHSYRGTPGRTHGSARGSSREWWRSHCVRAGRQ